ncbi:hypothetical protein GCM10027060_25510 [Nesterenkonia halophila]|uniref:hypothetical protein n=1 Tax=Nesterenkonia halophila TaxID=302044 RepID=UPI00129130F6|nr:hypothetical protein [Nesterenkonia halophila]
MSRWSTILNTIPSTGSGAGSSAGSSARRRGAVVMPLLAGAVLLTGCGAGAGDAADDGSSGEDSPPAGSEEQLAAAEAAMTRAASFGFDQAGYATVEAVEQFREQADETLAGDAAEDVDPAACADPLAAVDWAPLLLDADVARVDFGSETFTGTGSLEIAEASDGAAGERVAEHVARVEQLLGSCREVTYTQSEQDFALEFDGVDGVVEPEDSAEPETTTAYRWSREFAGTAEQTEQTGQTEEAESAEDGGTTAAQILLTRRGEDVVMVSFIGEPAAGSAEFTTMAEALAAETLDGLAD